MFENKIPKQDWSEHNYSNHSSEPIIQPKLKIGEENDEHEKEANHVADKIMRMTDDDEGQKKMVDEDEGKIKMMSDGEETKKMKDPDEGKIRRMADDSPKWKMSEGSGSRVSKMSDKKNRKLEVVIEKKDWKKDRKDNGEDVSFSDKDGAENRINELKKKGRWKDYQIKSSEDKKRWWVEMNGPQRIFRVAWTIDDGPQGVHTEEMKGNEGLNGLKQVTWYIQRSKLQGKEAAFKKLKTIQDEGGEIAIHSFHPTADHSTWFPVSSQYNAHGAYSTPYEGKSENDIVKDLEDFDNELKKYGINVKFVRLPGGLTSELTAYAKTLGLTDDDKIKEIKKDIIAKNDVTKQGKEAIQMQKDFQTLKDKLSALDLMEWSGTVDPLAIASQSWQSETSGVKARNDVTTYKISPGASQKGSSTNPKDAGVFERKLNVMEQSNQSSASLVILAHDSTLADAKAVAEDKKEMERLADIRGVVIEYDTMSSLFKNVTGKDPEKFDVKY